jgi:hypothetical protein
MTNHNINKGYSSYIFLFVVTIHLNYPPWGLYYKTLQIFIVHILLYASVFVLASKSDLYVHFL